MPHSQIDGAARSDDERVWIESAPECILVEHLDRLIGWDHLEESLGGQDEQRAIGSLHGGLRCIFQVDDVRAN